MGKLKNIGIITSGGDCGGLNAVVRGAAKAAMANGIGAYIIPNGEGTVILDGTRTRPVRKRALSALW